MKRKFAICKQNFKNLYGLKSCSNQNVAPIVALHKNVALLVNVQTPKCYWDQNVKKHGKKHDRILNNKEFSGDYNAIYRI